MPVSPWYVRRVASRAKGSRARKIALGSGLLVSAITAFFWCQLPVLHSLSLAKLVLLAGFYILVPVAGGALSSLVLYCVLSQKSGNIAALRFILSAVVLCSLSQPLLVLLIRLGSIWMVLVSTILFASLSWLLRRYGVSSAVMSSPREDFRADELLLAYSLAQREPGLFRKVLPSLLAAGLVQGAIALILAQWYGLASICMGLACALVTWRLNPRMKEWRLSYGIAAFLAVLVFTTITLLPFLKGAVGGANLSSFFSKRVFASSISHPAAGKGKGYVDHSFAGVILLTPPKPKPNLTPPSTRSPWAVGGHPTTPLVISFDGAYWYFRPPYSRPRPDALTVRDTPMNANIHSSDTIPLFMEAHQNLGSHIDLNCCAKIRLSVESAYSRAGTIALEIRLKDTLLRGMSPVSLGKIILPSSRRQDSPGPQVKEALTFPIPKGLPLQRFDEITVAVHSASDWMLIGPRLSIKQFELIPTGY